MKSSSKMADKVDVRANDHQYNTAKEWRIALFSFNDVATNLYLFLMFYVSIYASGVAGLLVAAVGFILTAMRMFDGITDPIVGYLIDKTNGRFGKFRPYMVIGNIILAASSLTIFFTLHLVPEGLFRLIYFIVMYMIYILGYTCQTACSKAAPSCITNNPRQRPKFGMWGQLYGAVAWPVLGLYVTSYLAGKYKTFNSPDLYREFVIVIVIASAILTTLAIIAVSKTDRTEYFGLGNKQPKVKFSDYWPVLKSNRAIQMLILAASSDKIALSVAGNATVGIMLFGILMGDISISGKLGTIVVIPNILTVLLATRYAGRNSLKATTVIGSAASIIMYTLMSILLFATDTTTITLGFANFASIAFVLLYIVGRCTTAVASIGVIPMISDCADYETYSTGRYIPGMMGTLFSFVDKMISSLATTIVALSITAIGYVTTTPDITDPITPELKVLTIVLFAGLPIFGWLCTLVAMKFYPLTKEKLVEVQAKIKELREAE